MREIDIITQNSDKITEAMKEAGLRAIRGKDLLEVVVLREDGTIEITEAHTGDQDREVHGGLAAWDVWCTTSEKWGSGPAAVEAVNRFDYRGALESLVLSLREWEKIKAAEEHQHQRETYEELNRRQQDEFNRLPIRYAFSHDRFREMMAGWNLCHGRDGNPTENDRKQVSRIYGNAYFRKADRELVVGTISRHIAEMTEAYTADKDGTGFILEMFEAELRNHEWSYTRDDTDALEALDLTPQQVHDDPALRRGLELAKAKILGGSEA